MSYKCVSNSILRKPCTSDPVTLRVVPLVPEAEAAAKLCSVASR